MYFPAVTSTLARSKSAPRGWHLWLSLDLIGTVVLHGAMLAALVYFFLYLATGRSAVERQSVVFSVAEWVFVNVYVMVTLAALLLVLEAVIYRLVSDRAGTRLAMIFGMTVTVSLLALTMLSLAMAVSSTDEPCQKMAWTSIFRPEVSTPV